MRALELESFGASGIAWNPPSEFLITYLYNIIIKKILTGTDFGGACAPPAPPLASYLAF